MKTFENPLDREHCRLDFHKALATRGQNDTVVLGMWARKWGEKIANHMIERMADEDLVDRSDLDEAEAECARAEKLADTRSRAINQACALLEKETPLVADALTILEAAE